jgi:hypothetical protein
MADGTAAVLPSVEAKQGRIDLRQFILRRQADLLQHGLVARLAGAIREVGTQLDGTMLEIRVDVTNALSQLVAPCNQSRANVF